MSNAEYTDRRSELEIPGSAEFSDAILVRAPRSAAERAVHVVVSAVAILLTSLVLFVGGTGELARLVAQLGIFCLAPVTVLILVRWSVKPSRTRAVRTVVLAGALALL